MNILIHFLEFSNDEILFNFNLRLNLFDLLFVFINKLDTQKYFFQALKIKILILNLLLSNTLIF